MPFPFHQSTVYILPNRTCLQQLQCFCSTRWSQNWAFKSKGFRVQDLGDSFTRIQVTQQKRIVTHPVIPWLNLQIIRKIHTRNTLYGKYKSSEYPMNHPYYIGLNTNCLEMKLSLTSGRPRQITLAHSVTHPQYLVHHGS